MMPSNLAGNQKSTGGLATDSKRSGKLGPGDGSPHVTCGDQKFRGGHRLVASGAYATMQGTAKE